MKFKLIEVERIIAPAIFPLDRAETRLRFTFSADDGSNDIYDAKMAITLLEKKPKAIEWLNAMVENELVFIEAKI